MNRKDEDGGRSPRCRCRPLLRFLLFSVALCVSVAEELCPYGLPANLAPHCKAATSCLSCKKHRKKAEEQGRKERKNTHKRTSCELPPFAPFRFCRRPEFRLRPKAAPSPSATFAVTIAAFAGMASRGVSAFLLRVPSWTSWFHEKRSGGQSPRCRGRPFPASLCKPSFSHACTFVSLCDLGG